MGYRVVEAVRVEMCNAAFKVLGRNDVHRCSNTSHVPSTWYSSR